VRGNARPGVVADIPLKSDVDHISAVADCGPDLSRSGGGCLPGGGWGIVVGGS
jgi:hypothetical protein